MATASDYSRVLAILEQRRANRRLAMWLLAAMLAFFVAYIARLTEITHDVFHEMALAREIFDSGFPTHDPFAFTPTVSPVVHHEWGTGVILYWATVGTGLGVAGLALLRWGLVAIMWLMLYRVARLRGAKPVHFALFSMLAFPVFWVGFSTLRAQLFTLTFVAIQLWFTELDWRGRRAWLIAWALLLVAWQNIHGGFVVGVGLMAFHVVERVAYAWLESRSWRTTLRQTCHLLWTPLIVVAVLPLNPWSWSYVKYLGSALTMARPTIAEWLPLWHTYAAPPTLLIFAISVGLAIAAIISQRRRRLVGVSALLLATYMALKHIRHGSIFAVLWIAYVPAWISRASWGRSLQGCVRRHDEVAVALAKCVVIASLAFATWHQFWMPKLPGTPRYSSICYPSEAVAYLQAARFSGRLLTPFHAGAYVSWEAFPQIQVSLDGRYEVAYSDGVLEEHDRFYDGGTAWWTVPDRFQADAILIPREALVAQSFTSWLADADSAEPPREYDNSWELVYRDASYIVAARRHLRMPVVNRAGRIPEDHAAEAFCSAAIVRQ